MPTDEFHYAFYSHGEKYYCLVCLETEPAGLNTKEEMLTHLRDKHAVKSKFEAVMHPDVYKDTLQAFGEVIDLLAVAGAESAKLEAYRLSFEQLIWNTVIRKAR